MFCYYCMEHGRDVRAVALCRWCGGAACYEHVLDVRSAAEPVALIGPQLPPRHEFVCRRCWDSHTHPAAQATTTRPRQIGQREGALPEATDAVRLAEAFLRDEHSHHQSHPWSRLQALWSLLACRLKIVRFNSPRDISPQRERP